MTELVDPRTGQLLDTDSIPGLADVAALHAEQITRLHVELQSLQEPAEGTSGSSRFAWRSLSARQAETLWRQVADWVGWLRGRYPLARQIPPCWWRHPELVEELTALWLAWREAYVEKSAPLTAAIDWHDRWLPGFLRRIGTGGWNLACEGEHKERLASLYDGRCVDDEDAFAAHVSSDVAGRRRKVAGGETAKEAQLEQIDDATMRQALEAGMARQVGSLPGSPVSYDGAYWSRGGSGWERVEDPDTIEFLENAERRLRLADRAVDEADGHERP